MSLDFFRVDRGLQLDDTTTYLTGSGAPGASIDTIAVVVGSVYTDTADGALYTKIASGAGLDKWQRMASEQYVNNAVGTSLSWREPVAVKDSTSTTLPTGTAGSPIVIQGQTIGDQGRVLFSNISGGGGKNIYVYNQALGSFVEDTNQESNGDATYVEFGNDAGKTFVFNGTDWVLTDQASSDEIGFIQAFVGKNTSGNVSPDYTSNNFVVDGTDLVTAVSALDAELGANVALGNWISPALKVNGNVTALDNVIGPNFGSTNHLTSLATTGTVAGNLATLDGLFGPSLIAGSYVTAGEAAFPAIQALDIAIGANVSSGNYILSTNKVQQNIQTLDTAIGPNVTNGGYISSANTVQGNVQALDAALTNATQLTEVTNVTSTTLIDAVPAAQYDAVKFFVFVEEAANPANRYATELYVMTDGSDVDYTKYATLKLGATIVGLQVGATFNAGAMSVQVSSTAAVNVKVRRGTVV